VRILCVEESAFRVENMIFANSVRRPKGPAIVHCGNIIVAWNIAELMDATAIPHKIKRRISYS
jgi:hypothetical protein